MAKRFYTQETLDSYLKKNIAMDFIETMSGQCTEYSEAESLSNLLDHNTGDLNYIDCDSIY